MLVSRNTLKSSYDWTVDIKILYERINIDDLGSKINHQWPAQPRDVDCHGCIVEGTKVSQMASLSIRQVGHREKGKHTGALYRELACCLYLLRVRAISNRSKRQSPAHKGLIARWPHHGILAQSNRCSECLLRRGGPKGRASPDQFRPLGIGPYSCCGLKKKGNRVYTSRMRLQRAR
jgi:hypothetical protein